MSTIKQNKDALGKGIRSLLENINSDLKTTEGAHLKSSVVEAATSVVRIPLGRIVANPKNPRKDFGENALKELAESLKRFDVVQPITVSKLANGNYQLIAGERRLRAALLAGLADVPAYIRQANDAELLELALLENLQREDLNPIEVALSYKRMMDELHYTQEQVAERMGKERSTVANFLRCLKLPPDIQLAVRNNVITMGHARSIVSLDTVDKQLYLFNEVKERSLNVRQTEDLVRKLMNQEIKPVNRKPKSALPAAYKRIEDNLASHFSTKVTLNHNVTKGAGSINIEYYSLEEFNKILEMMNVGA